jgi:type I restriction enzyme M protein
MTESSRASRLVSRLWQYCNVLRDDGLSYPDYVEQLTYLLFLKMVDENKTDQHTTRSDWALLRNASRPDLPGVYQATLTRLGSEPGLLGLIFAGSRNKIRDSSKLQLLITELIGGHEWSSLGLDVKGAVYEGLLEKNAQDTKSGAGQYFTPRPLIESMVACLRPSTPETVLDPACGTGGFLIASAEAMRGEERDGDAPSSVSGIMGFELVPEVARLAAMNLYLHRVGSFDHEGVLPVHVRDCLTMPPNELFDVILANPPFGSRSTSRIVTSAAAARERDVVREDFWESGSNKELNFLQHIALSLKPGGRAAVIVPDGVLSSRGAAARVRRRLLEEFEVHTVLRLPPGLFYAQSVNANVLFFDRPLRTRSGLASRVLSVYDLRTDMKYSLNGRRLSRADLAEFESLFRQSRDVGAADDRRHQPQRWKQFDAAKISVDPDCNLALTWNSAPLPSDVIANDVSPAELITGLIEDLELVLLETKALLDDVKSDE